MIPPFSIDGWLFRLGLALSLAIHLAGFAYFWLHKPGAPGATPFPTAAISVNLETTDIFDAQEDSPAKTAAAAQAVESENSSPAAADGEQKPAEPETEEKTEPATEAIEAKSERGDAKETPLQGETGLAEPDAPPSKPDDTAEQRAEQKAAEEALRKEREARRRREDAEEQDRKRREAARKRRIEKERQAEKADKKERRAKAQARASGSGKARASAGRVSASQGAILNYAATVRARIARSKPPSGGRRGQVMLSFSLSSSGRLTSAHIARSSGDRSLDQSALAAIRRAAPFPRPPSGATPGQLRFTIPFRFR